MTDHLLQKEIETYNANLPELLRSVGRFVLIKGDHIEGICDTYADAIKIGYERFKLAPFFVKQIAAPSKSVGSRANLTLNAQHKPEHPAERSRACGFHRCEPSVCSRADSRFPTASSDIPRYVSH
jgi:hypothetical protein